MSLICEKCRAENAATNLFCGHCGAKLNAQHLRADDTPEEFWRESRSADSSSGSSSTVAAGSANPDPFVATGSPTLQTPQQPESRQPAATEQHEVPGVAPAALPASFHPNTDQPPSWKDGIRPENQAEGVTDRAGSRAQTRTGVTGPSFLGLTDDEESSPPYEEDDLADYDEEPPSRQSNLALIVLALAAALITLQWHSIRDHGLAYIQNGTQRVFPGLRTTNPPAVAADNTHPDLGASNPANAAPGAPQSVQDSPNAGRDMPVQSNDKSSSAIIDPLQPPPQPPSTMSAPPADMPQSASEPASSPDEPAVPETRSRPSHASRADTGKAVPGSGPGAEEMRHAATASDPDARAVWLWRAVGKGNPEAPVQLATMYELGDGVRRSCDQARLLLTAAAERGNVQAKVNLQQLLRDGCPAR